MNLLKELINLNKETLDEAIINQVALDDLVAKALDAFWKVITDKYPEFKPTDLPKDAVMKFDAFDKEAKEMVHTLIKSSK